MIWQEQNIRMQKVRLSLLEAPKARVFFFVQLVIILRRKIFVLFSVCHFFDILIIKF